MAGEDTSQLYTPEHHSGRLDQRLNSTNYIHPQETNLLNLHKAMEYNDQGQPCLRTTSGASPATNDAFGRLRVSNPYTFFENFTLYNETGKFVNNTANGGTVAINTNAGLIEQAVTTTSGSRAYRETVKVFAYQPGKSLMVLESFVFAPAQTNLRQRIGYFDVNNGIYCELENNILYFVIRSKVTGSVVETRVSQANWNIDSLNGTGVSTLTLDITKSQILYVDLEWLGVGTVRCGFVIDGQFILAHQFQHANIISSTYMTTACLPVRTEIENTGVTAAASTMKSICATVVSEGGYSLIGRPQSIGHPISTPYTLSTKDTLYPVLALRLKEGRNNAIVLPNDFSIGVSANANFRFQLIHRAVTSGGTWVSAGAQSSVEYNLTATTITNGTIMEQGYIMATNQSSAAPSMAAFPFQYQLDRDTFSNTMYEFVIAVECSVNTTPCYVSINWEEVT